MPSGDLPSTPARHPYETRTGALPDLVIIGAMKCGTTALHGYLDHHPDIAMSRPKELNFFFGAEQPPGQDDRRWANGNWHLGLVWYADQFPASAPLRGEASPGYTSPDHPEVAERMAAIIPGVRLIYLVRDPIERALSQYRHHRAEGTERRPLPQALTDPASQYVSRGRYHERLQPFLARFPQEQVLVVALEDLRRAPVATLRRVFGFVGAGETFRHTDVPDGWHTSDTLPHLDASLRARLQAALRDDVDRLRALVGGALPEWPLTTEPPR